MAITAPSPCIPDEGIDARIPGSPFSVITLIEVKERLASGTPSSNGLAPTSENIGDSLGLTPAQVHAALQYYYENQSTFDAELLRRKKTSKAALANLFKKHGNKSSLVDIIGSWPGDETDEEIDAALERMS